MLVVRLTKEETLVEAVDDGDDTTLMVSVISERTEVDDSKGSVV